MSNVFDQIYAEGFEVGYKEGLEEAREQRLVEYARNIVKKLKIAPSDALDALGIPKPEQARYLSML